METRKRPVVAGTGRFWVVQQHDELSVVESNEPPSTEVEAGERMKRVRGPYATRELANKNKERLEGKTLRVLAGGGR